MAPAQGLIDQLKSGIPSILILDDDLHIITGLRDVLEDNDYRVETATCAAEARDLLRRKTFCAIVSDYSLPDENGVQLLDDAKKLYPSLGLILMTGHDLRHITEKIDQRAMTFLRKPVDVQVLLDSIEGIIQAQCAASKMEWKPKALAAPKAPLNPPTAFPRVVIDVPLTEPPPEPTPDSTAWMFPLGWCALVLASFGAGWLGHGYLVNRGLLKPPAIAVPVVAQAPLVAADPSAPPLVQEAKEEPDPPAAEPVIVKVQKPARPNWVAQLAASDHAVRIKAAKMLLKNNSDQPAAIVALRAIVADPASRQHLAAIQTLSSAGASTPEVIASLASALKEDDPEVAYAAASALGHLGKSALPALGELITALNYHGGSVPSIMQAAQNAIVNIGDPAVPALNDALNDLKIKQQVSFVLARLNKPASSDSTPSAPLLSQNKAPALQPLSGVDDLPDTEPSQAAAAPSSASPLQ